MTDQEELTTAHPGPRSTATGGVSLRHLLRAQPRPLLELRAAPRGLDVEVREVGILDPENPAPVRRGEVVLAIGVRGGAVLPALRAADAARAAAVVVRLDGPDHGGTLDDVAAAAGVAMLSVRRETRWEEVDSLVRAVLGGGGTVPTAERAPVSGDLFTLAQTVSSLTGGIVSIEDTAHRVLAYSRSSEEGDDLRRTSILGGAGPEPYLSRLREWGVFAHLRTSSTVIAVEARPELGLRRRLAVGVRARNQPLGTIWVQEGAQPFAAGAEQALLGAARVAAPHLVRRRRELSADARLTQASLVGLLDGSTGPQALTEHLGLDPRRPAALVGFGLRPPGGGAAGDGTVQPEGNELEGSTPEGSVEFARDEVLSLLSVYAAARHHSAVVAPLGCRVYVLFPELPARFTPDVLRGWVREIVAAASSHVGVSLRAAVGPVAAELAGAAFARREVDRVLRAMARGEVAAQIASLEEVRDQVVVGEILALLATRRDLRDPRLTALAERDRRSGTHYVETLLTYLDAFGDVGKAAARLQLHRNTLRYRIRRAQELTGLDLSRPEQRLLTMLQLRMAPAHPRD